jgi:5-methylcytosine-specific restriction endonuclease McrA
MRFNVRLPKLKVSDQQLLDDLIAVAKLLEKNTLSQKEYNKHGRYSMTSYRNHFGTWKMALEKANLKRTRNWGTRREEFLENIKDMWIKLGRQPKYSEIAMPFSKYSATAYAHYFGNWTKALIEFEKYLGEEDVDTVKAIEAKPVIDRKQHKTKRQVNWRLRFKVMQRDNFKCKSCGRSPATDPKIILHVDHIKAWANGGETVLENLQTLCSKCNIGKSNLSSR